MARYLVIVESPTKVKTIKKFLGSNYVVMASNGHVRDLPKSQMGVDLEHDFEPKYITIRGKGEILAGLRKEVKKADKIYLATDPDREGEAISWHLMKALKLEGKKVYRISFNEITKSAVKASLKNARDIDMDLVDAQQARRVLDRTVLQMLSFLLSCLRSRYKDIHCFFHLFFIDFILIKHLPCNSGKNPLKPEKKMFCPNIWMLQFGCNLPCHIQRFLRLPCILLFCHIILVSFFQSISVHNLHRSRLPVHELLLS